MRVIIFTNKENPAGNYFLNRIVKDKDVEIVGIFNAKNFKFSQLLKHTEKALLLGGVLVSLRLVTLLLSLKFVSFIKRKFYSKRKLYNADEIAKINKIPYHYVNGINSKESIAIIKKLKPDIIISSFFDQILRKRVLDIPRLGVINIHPGILPNYRGLYPYFWKLVHKEKISGVTIHTMTEEIDKGKILAIKTFRIRKKDDVISLSIKSGKVGVKLLKKTLKQIKKHGVNSFKVKPVTTLKKSGYFGLPTKEAVSKLYKQNKEVWSFRKLLKYF